MLLAASMILVGFVVLVWSADLFVDGELSPTDGWLMIALLVLILAQLVMRQLRDSQLLEEA